MDFLLTADSTAEKFLLMFIVIALFIILQKQFIAGVASTGIKG